MRNRLLMALVFVPIFLFCITVGKIPFILLISAIALCGLAEFYQIVRAKGIKPLPPLGFLMGAVLLFYARSPQYLSLIIIGGIFAALLFQLVRKEQSLSMANCAVTVFGPLYVVLLFSYLISLRYLEGGRELVFAVWFITWMGDSAALGVGTCWGKHKFFPRISPNKTLEGAIGGVSAAVAASFVAYFALGALFKSHPFPLSHALFLGLGLGVVGITGDLCESLLKRDARVKDSGGKTIPGHGGILDIFDSLIFTAPMMYFYAKFILHL